MSGLQTVEIAGLRLLTDPLLESGAGILVAFSTRGGGDSASPYASLNLAAHVGDDPVAVDANRALLLDALGIGSLRSALTAAEQVHGTNVAIVGSSEAGRGAYAAGDVASPPVAGADALVTTEPAVPLMMLFADCVPVVLVARGPVRAISVVHAGWKGALGRIAGRAAERLAAVAQCRTSDLLAYIGPHVCPDHYRVDARRLSQFTKAFGSIAAARGGLDLGAVVTSSLNEVGVPLTNVVRANVCTAERTEQFFSFRAEGTTGRHAALSVILESPR